MKKYLSILFALVLAVSLMLVPAVATPVAANPGGVTVTLNVSFSGYLTSGGGDTKLDFGWALGPDMDYYDAYGEPYIPPYPNPLMKTEFNNFGTYKLYPNSAPGAHSFSETLTLVPDIDIGDYFEIDAYLHAQVQNSPLVNGTITMTVSALGAAIEPVFGQYGAPTLDLGDLTFFYPYVNPGYWPWYTEGWWDWGDMSNPGASVHIGSNVGECSTSDDWSIPFDNSDQFSMEVCTAAPGGWADAAARIRVRYKVVPLPMSEFQIDHAKIDFKKKADDDKVRVKGKLELDTVNGDGVDISEDVIVTVGTLSETITMVVKGKNGEKWEYKRPKGESGIKHMKIDWKKYPEAKFDIRVDKVDLGEMSDWTNPVTISIQIGDDVGSETILMREKKHHWDYKAK